MKPESFLEPQLLLKEQVLAPCEEWPLPSTGWITIHISAGVGYCLHPHNNCELATGTVLVASEHIRASLRASQVTGLRLQFFRVEPAKLTGLVTLADQKVMRDAALEPARSLRVLPADERVSERFRRLGAADMGASLPTRVQLLQLFLELFDGKFHAPQPESAEHVDARARLKMTLHQTPLSDLIEFGFAGLVSRTRCSPRHVSRLFTELVGVSFREKQSELRLGHACELLATTDSKVSDVAQESGYQSTSLFSVMFKQRFGTSPAKWREQTREYQSHRSIHRRSSKLLRLRKLTPLAA